MATRIEAFQVTVPPGTLQSTPLDTDLSFVSGEVDTISILIPPGPSGTAGFAFVHSGQQIIPFASGEFVIAEAETITWPVEGFPSGRGWIFRAYNEDVYPHTFYIRLSITEREFEGGATSIETETPDVSDLTGVVP